MADAIETVGKLRRREATVVLVGQGYVGLPLALRAAVVGYDVIGFDTDLGRVRALAAGSSYVGDVADAELQASLKAGYRPTSDPTQMAGFDVAIVTVPTPLADGRPDLSFIAAAAETLAPHMRRDCVVVLESTTYPGTTEEFVAPILERGSGLLAGRDYFLGYSPERVDPGNQQWTLVNTPKVVSGVDAGSLDVIDAFYGSLVDTTVRLDSCAEAEMAKLLENTFRHVNIALVNELAVFANLLGVDIWKVIDAASTKPFGFMRFTPGPGVGGHCLPVDPSYLAWRITDQLGESFRFVELANEVNSAMPDYVVSRTRALLAANDRDLRGAEVLLLGLSFKRGTSDCRESPSMVVAEALLREGASVLAADPYVSPLNLGEMGFGLVPLDEEALRRVDIVLLLVDHPEFTPTLVAHNARLVLDAKGVLRGVPFRGEVL